MIKWVKKRNEEIKVWDIKIYIGANFSKVCKQQATVRAKIWPVFDSKFKMLFKQGVCQRVF